uniref:Uncharacterized protein n=1 Tax=Anguilla anguilla TaxID=7936 RepID=A0A0E9S7B3_ANGAN
MSGGGRAKQKCVSDFLFSAVVPFVPWFPRGLALFLTVFDVCLLTITIGVRLWTLAARGNVVRDVTGG